MSRRGSKPNLVSVIIVGKPISKVKTLPNKIESEGESFFCFLSNSVRPAKHIPDKIAKIFPKNPSDESSSKKKSAKPESIIAMVAPVSYTHLTLPTNREV